MDNIEKLYKIYSILADAKEKITEHEEEYLESLLAVKGSSSEKRLASQIISRFFKHFPKLANQAIDAQLDLCEDDDVSIRKQAIKDLPTFCKDSPEHLQKIADILTQLLQTEDTSELSTVHNSLMTLFKIDSKGTLGGLFTQMITGEEIVRERAIKFLSAKLKTLSDDVLSKEAEEFFIQETKKVLQDVTGEEFAVFMMMISNLKIAKTVAGHQQIVELITEQADLTTDFDYMDIDNVDRIIQCTKQAVPYFSSQVESTRFIEYFVDKVLPVLSEIKSPEDGIDLQLELLKILAEISPYCGSLDSAHEKMDRIFSKLLEFMPLPPCEENGENSTSNPEPKLEFSYVECLMYTFHQVGKKHPDFLTNEENTDRLKDFRLRLQYFARGIQGYIKKLREALKGKKGDDLKLEENRIKVMALKTTSNINILIRDLFHNPPSYKSSITLSWRPPLPTASSKTPVVSQKVSPIPTIITTGNKRSIKTPITFSDGPSPSKKIVGSKQERELYAPPSGKYSTKVKNFTLPTRGGNTRRGRGFGFNRGRRGRGGRYY